MIFERMDMYVIYACIFIYFFAPNMQSEDCFDLLSHFSALSLTPAPAAPRQTGLVMAPQMPWNSTDCRIGLQFKNVYLSRMSQLSERFSVPGVINIAQVSENGTRYCITGIIKRLEAKRVRAFQKEYPEKYAGGKTIFDENDELEIEDKTGKLKLSLNQCTVGTRKIQATDLPYGVQVVVEGRFKKHSNRFSARHLYLPSLAPQHTIRPDYITRNGVSLSGKRILIMSEPSPQQCQTVAQQLQASYSEELRSITAVVVIGGMDLQVESISRMAAMVETLKHSVDVFIMPSSNADRRRMFPLQPYNGNFFAKSQTNIGLCCNPQQFNVENGLRLHVSCGENVLDFMRNCTMAEDELEVLEQMVNFSHYCPTAPFSLRTEPYMEDHLVMEEMPHVMVAGKAKSFACRMLRLEDREVLLVAVPAGGMGLVSLEGMQARSFN